ncbi:MAG TPA: DinB family protein [Chloroflexia bacterium]|nr:DinB family protein [Chloroflexia bacterium]
MTKDQFVAKFKATRAVFLSTLNGLQEQEASVASGPAGDWVTIKDLIGHIASWEREVLIADEMIKRGEESYLGKLNFDEFNRAQSEHRRNWSLAQVMAELDLNYEALLMAWDEYEDDDGPFGPATWQPEGPDSLYWLISHQVEHGSDIARRRGLQVVFPQ